MGPASDNSNNANTVEGPLLKTFKGTSMSTPITAGSTVLKTVQTNTSQVALMKAVLLNGTNTDGVFF